MNIIFVPRRGGRTNAFRLNAFVIYFLLFLLAAVFAVFAVGGYQLAGAQGQNYAPSALISVWQKELRKQSEEIDSTRQATKDNMDALAIRLGRLQAHVMRLDALGDRLTKKANLDKGEFDFSKEPAQGGPAESANAKAASMDVPDFVASIESLSKQLENRAQQLGLLETMMMNRDLQDEVVPAGRPINSGWLSSYFGVRTDPFTGHKAHHGGVDFAGKLGSDIVSVAAGVVTWADRRYGYGNLVEINHGNGYVTRYGHAQEILVSVGDTVKKGDVLALMGSTGRSTGPHVHFEVILNDKTVDPIKFIRKKIASAK